MCVLSELPVKTEQAAQTVFHECTVLATVFVMTHIAMVTGLR